MNKILILDSLNTKFLESIINSIFFSKNILKKDLLSAYPFYSNFEINLKNKLDKIKDQRCLGYVKVFVEKYDENITFLKCHREQGNLKARLIKNYDANDELIIINTAGGLTSGDLNVNLLKVSKNIKLNITTQSMEKIYNCKNFSANSYTNITVGENSYVSWLPLETIFYNGGNFRRRINIDLSPNANFLGIETMIFGRKAMGEKVNKGYLDDAWQIHQNGKLLYSDFNRISGNIYEILKNPIVMKGNNIFCNIVFKGKKVKFYKNKLLDLINKSKYFAGVSIVNEVLLLKVLSKDILEIRMFINKMISIFDGNFNIPKIWSF